MKGVPKDILKQDIIDGKSITLCYPEFRIYSSAIVTGNIPIATGAAFAFATASGSSATNGNYTITKTGANTFTLTDINSGTIAASTAMSYSTLWLCSYDTGAGDLFGNFALIPGEGILVRNGIYMIMTNVTSANIYYG